jgi:hypothetical protein
MEDFMEGFTMRWTPKQEARMNDLFSKYGQDYSGVGDEIDLETGDIIVNNGHIEGMRHERDTGDQKPSRQRRPTAMDRHRAKIRSNNRPQIRRPSPDIMPMEFQASLPPRALPIQIHHPRKRSPTPDEDGADEVGPAEDEETPALPLIHVR